MTFLSRASHVLARAAALCLMLAASPVAAEPPDPLAWRDAPTLQALVDHLDRWLDRQSDLPRRDRPVDLRLVSAAKAAALAPDHLGAGQSRLRGLYDPDGAVIWLVSPWDPRDPRDVSILLHELAHHRQQGAQHWYCPGAQELPAYRLQAAWLADLGLDLDVNWIAVVLAADCSRRDIHPD